MCELQSVYIITITCTCLVTLVYSQTLVLMTRLQEEQPPNTVVCNIPDDAGLKYSFTQHEMDNFRYRLLPGGHSQYFHVDEQSGAILTRASIDREVLCTTRSECTLHVEVVITQSAEFFKIIEIEVIITDFNDHHPDFEAENVNLTLSEGTHVGKTIRVPQAVDGDSGQYGIYMYVLDAVNDAAPVDYQPVDYRTPAHDHPARGIFELMTELNLEGVLEVYLKLMKPLDYERERELRLRLTAFDGGDPPLTAQLLITIIRTDINDNTPVFNHNVYSATIHEDLEPFSSVIQIQATDPDIGAGGEVMYSLSGESSLRYGDVFSIDNITGVIFLSTNLTSIPPVACYSLVIQAWDLAQPSRKTFAKVTINIIDVNNHAPNITISGLRGHGDPSVTENRDRGTVVALVMTTDLDEGDNAAVGCLCIDDEFLLIKLYDNKFKLVTQSVLDRELKDTHTVTVTCHDKGVPSLVTNMTAEVKVLDENDNMPLFDQDCYTVYIEESTEQGVTVITVTASDRDTDTKSHLSYHLMAYDDDDDREPILNVETSTGKVTLMTRTDYETKRHFMYSLTVSDNGQPSLTGTATLIIDVVNVNDEAPVFSNAAYSFGILENQPSGTVVGRVAATDKDSPPFDNFMFALDSSSEYLNNTFLVDSFSGKIAARRPLDRELQSTYYMTVAVSDTADPRLSSTARVTVYVADVNDNSPVITFPSPDNNTLTLSMYTSTGHTFTKIKAYDPDLGSNGLLNFSITCGNDEEYFGIGDKTGVMLVRKLFPVFEHSEMLRVNVCVTVTDAGTPSLSSHVNITVAADPSLPYYTGESALNSQNKLSIPQKIIVTLSVVAAVLATLFVMAIIFAKRRRFKDSNKNLSFWKRHFTSTDKQLTVNNSKLNHLQVLSTESPRWLKCHSPVYRPETRYISTEPEKASFCSDNSDSGHGASEDADMQSASCDHNVQREFLQQQKPFHVSTPSPRYSENSLGMMSSNHMKSKTVSFVTKTEDSAITGDSMNEIHSPRKNGASIRGVTLLSGRDKSVLGECVIESANECSDSEASTSSSSTSGTYSL